MNQVEIVAIKTVEEASIVLKQQRAEARARAALERESRFSREGREGREGREIGRAVSYQMREVRADS